MTELPGLWFDGRSSRAMPVRLVLRGGCLHLAAGDGSEVVWPVGEIDVSPRLGNAPRVLRRAGSGHVECADSPLLDAWQLVSRGRVERFADWLERRRAAILAAAAIAVVATVGFVRYGVPALASAIAERIPHAAERQLSDQVVFVLERGQLGPSLLPPRRQAALRTAFGRLVAGEPRSSELRLRFASAPGIGPNAFALPDGRIYMTDALVELAESDAELLAVLAHEAGHHVHRHGMRQAIESSSVALAAGLLLGDLSGSSLAVSIPAVLLESGFSRGHEREADSYAFALLLRRGLSPEAFASIMGRLSKQAPDGAEAVAGYLSTHPPTPERIRKAREATEKARGNTRAR